MNGPLGQTGAWNDFEGSELFNVGLGGTKRKPHLTGQKWMAWLKLEDNYVDSDVYWVVCLPA